MEKSTFYYDSRTSSCPDAKKCNVAKMKFCLDGDGDSHKACQIYRAQVNAGVHATLDDTKPLTATVDELTRTK